MLGLSGSIEMVHIRDVNYDTLDKVMSYLKGKDLVNAALVSRSFWLAVVPIMYHTIVFDQRLASKYPKVCLILFYLPAFH